VTRQDIVTRPRRPGRAEQAPSQPRPGPDGAPATRRRRVRIGGGPVLYLLPLAAFLLVWIYLPLAFTGLLSFLHWNLVSDSRPFAGAQNYAQLLARPDFTQAATKTVLYIAGMLPFATVFPMAMAIMLWKHPGRAATAYRSLIFLPVVLAPVAVAIAWEFILAPLQGVVDTVLTAAGVPAPDWLGSAATALWAIVVITGTKIFALNVLIYLAGLAAVDRGCVEAARLDGASEWGVTRHILVPLLSRTTALTSFLCLVLSGQWAFVNIAVLTQGGPVGASDNVFYLLYQYGFSYFNTGLASAGAVVITAALALAATAHQLISSRTVAGDR
jgi:multiple sugar transport system permease protein